jgi:hypothetical protein
MIDMMTVVRDMTPTKTFVCGFDTVTPTGVSIHEHRRIEYRDAITVQILIVLTLPVNDHSHRYRLNHSKWNSHR